MAWPAAAYVIVSSLGKVFRHLYKLGSGKVWESLSQIYRLVLDSKWCEDAPNILLTIVCRSFGR